MTFVSGIKMHSLRLKNVRSLKDTDHLEIKPLTILLGQNSSGKSTFLRTIPLLKQSIRARASSPLLWWGDFVDFGSIEEVKSSFCGQGSVGFEVCLDRTQIVEMNSINEQSPLRFTSLITFGFDLDEREGKTQLRGFSLKLDSDTAKFVINNNGEVEAVSINGFDFSSLIPKERYFVSTSELVPQFFQRQDGTPDELVFSPRPRRAMELLSREIKKFYTERLHGGMGETTISNLARRVTYAPTDAFVGGLRSIETSKASWHKFVDTITSPAYSSSLLRLRSLHLLAAVPAILTTLDRSLNYVLSGTSYVGPARASVERYYRIQELNVDQIDPQGKNLAMFLHSLPLQDQEKFSNWLEEAIGYRIHVDRASGHIRLRLRERGSNQYYNIIDMGYGFSQILPIMAQVWLHQHKKRRFGAFPIVVMEQPELHLHPAYQARLADIFTNAINSFSDPQVRGWKGNKMRFLVETHSEAFINRIGELIYQREFSADDVAIYIFEKGRDHEATMIKKAAFSEDGTINNWPIGFFSAVS